MNIAARVLGALWLSALLANSPALAQERHARDEVQWAGSWAAPPQDFAQPLPWAGAPPATPPMLDNQTLRQRLQPTLGGRRVRIRFSNLFGKVPLRIATASVARSMGSTDVSPATVQRLSFSGRAGVTIGPGAEVWSDAAPFEVAPDQIVSISFRVDAPVPFATVHQITPGATRVTAGDAVLQAHWPAAATSPWNHIVTGLDVVVPRAARVIVAFGDSITAGAGIEGEGNSTRYPERLALRLRGQSGRAASCAVLNAGISGNRLLSDGAGTKGIERFRRDALGQSGVTHAIVLIGINDIGMGLQQRPGAALVAPSVDQITAGIQQLIEQARGVGVKVLLGTLLPFRGAAYWSAEKELRRAAVNRWIRGKQDIDGVVDFDAALRDPADPMSLKPVYDLGDHLHPNVAGHAAMADAIDLRELEK